MLHKNTVLVVLALFLFGVGVWHVDASSARTPDPSFALLSELMAADREAPIDAEIQSFTPCVNGFAGSYPCQNLDLATFMPLGTIGGGSGNDVWGWTDPLTGSEYALMGRTNGTAFVDVTNPTNPVYLGNMPTRTFSTTWRDIKTNGNYAYIVSEASGHGIQIFDLTRLRNVTNPPVTFLEDGFYSQFSNAHNIAINEDSGYAYAVGTNTCSGGLHMVNLSNPTNPTFAGCYSGDGYTHDVQCVNYIGPDPDHQGSEICLASNEDTLTIVDVTNKSNPTLISRTPYSGAAYTHQGWLTPDHRFFALDDELDELFFGHGTRTRVFNVIDLDNPQLAAVETSSNPAIDHNQYLHAGYAFQANYRSGLRVLNFQRQEVAYFDIYPGSDAPSFNGAWSVYPFFASNTILVSGIEQGLFILTPATNQTAFVIGD